MMDIRRGESANPDCAPEHSTTPLVDAKEGRLGASDLARTVIILTPSHTVGQGLGGYAVCEAGMQEGSPPPARQRAWAYIRRQGGSSCERSA